MKLRNRLNLQAVGWVIILANYFFLTYSQTNQFTATRSDVGSIVFGWEQHIPFLPLTIIPYWSLDILYGLSLFTCSSSTEQHRLALRLLLASTIACIGFLLFPLQYSFIRPEINGFTGWWFTQLEQFDLPYNQSPSLHIILCWLLWQHFLNHTPKRIHWFIHSWFLLIAVSVLTTWQHHFIDVITGLAVGMFIDWLIPTTQNPSTHHTATPQSRKLAKYYGLATILSLIGSIILTPWLLWLAIALLIVTSAYTHGANQFRKHNSNKYTQATYWLLLPWRWLITLSHYWYNRQIPSTSPILHNISLGSYPYTRPTQQAILDLTSELPRARSTHTLAYSCIPMLDLVSPSLTQLHQAVIELETLRQKHNSVLVHCALGLSRSATVVIAWLFTYGHFETAEQAYNFVKQQRPQIILTPQHIELLQQWKIKQTQISTTSH